MPGVTEEQIIAARQMTAIEFLQRYRPEELVKVGSRGEFQLRAHDSFKINGETSNFHWKSRDVGGKSALDYLVKVEEMRFVDAVLTLCEESPGYIPPPPRTEQKKEFVLPPAAESNRRVFAYLMKRGIDRKVIDACFRAGTEGIHLHHDRFGFSNGISQRDLTFCAQACRHKVFGDVPSHVCTGTIHLGGILSGECAPAVRGEHAVAVHHELSSGETGIGFRAAKHKTPGRVQEDFRILIRGHGP